MDNKRGVSHQRRPDPERGAPVGHPSRDLGPTSYVARLATGCTDNQSIRTASWFGRGFVLTSMPCSNDSQNCLMGLRFRRLSGPIMPSASSLRSLLGETGEANFLRGAGMEFQHGWVLSGVEEWGVEGGNEFASATLNWVRTVAQNSSPP